MDNAIIVNKWYISQERSTCQFFQIVWDHLKYPSKSDTEPRPSFLHFVTFVTKHSDGVVGSHTQNNGFYGNGCGSQRGYGIYIHKIKTEHQIFNGFPAMCCLVTTYSDQQNCMSHALV